ncbi:MAG: hypothetical protein ACKVX9_07055 [Blastocatellia bacterium]
MSEERDRLHRAYKRAGIGLGAAALLWTGAILLGGRLEENNVRWLIPMGAAALSVYCFSVWAKSRDEE